MKLSHLYCCLAYSRWWHLWRWRAHCRKSSILRCQETGSSTSSRVKTCTIRQNQCSITTTRSTSCVPAPAAKKTMAKAAASISSKTAATERMAGRLQHLITRSGCSNSWRSMAVSGIFIIPYWQGNLRKVADQYFLLLVVKSWPWYSHKFKTFMILLISWLLWAPAEQNNFWAWLCRASRSKFCRDWIYATNWTNWNFPLINWL